MKTILIGYSINEGTMKDKKTGDDIRYNSRVIRFISDMGANDKNIGFEPFEAKFKMDDLARILCVNPDSQSVNEALNRCINKAVVCTYAPVYGVLSVVGFSLEK